METVAVNSIVTAQQVVINAAHYLNGDIALPGESHSPGERCLCCERQAEQGQERCVRECGPAVGISEHHTFDLPAPGNLPAAGSVLTHWNGCQRLAIENLGRLGTTGTLRRSAPVSAIDYNVGTYAALPDLSHEGFASAAV